MRVFRFDRKAILSAGAGAFAALSFTAGGAEAQQQAFFQPVSAWNVTESVASAAGTNPQSCVMMTEYDNGYTVRISGGGGQIIAMSVDFMQGVFEKGKSYPVTLAFASGFQQQMAAQAYNSSTLVFDLRQLDVARAKFSSNENMSLTLGPVQAVFSLAGAAGGMRNLDQCTGVAPSAAPLSEPPQVASAQPVMPEPAAVAEEVMIRRPQENSSDQTGQVARNEAMEWQQPRRQKPDVSGQTSQMPQDSGMPGMKTPEPPRARAPQIAADEVLSAPVAPMVPAPASPVQAGPSRDLASAFGREGAISRAPEFPEPVSAPMERLPGRDDSAHQDPATPQPLSAPPETQMNPAAVTAPSAQMAMTWQAREGEDIRTVLKQWAQIAGYDFVWQADRSGTVRDNVQYEGSFENAVAQLLSESGKASGIRGEIDDPAKGDFEFASDKRQAMATPMRPSTWHAIRGTDMRNVLQLWSREAGVRLLWDSSVDFPIKKTVSMKGDFQTALESLLAQYNGESIRPVGRLHQAARGAEPVLVIEMQRAS